MEKKIKLNKMQNSRLTLVNSYYSMLVNTDKSKIEDILNNIRNCYQEIKDSIEFEDYNMLINSNQIDDKFLSMMASILDSNTVDASAIISKYLAEGWTIDKLDLLIKSILTMAVSEIMLNGDAPIKVIIDDYVTITNLYYGKNEVGFINSILDKIAREVRPKELNASI